LDLTVQSLQTASENQRAAESRIRDADFAYETAVFTRNQILVQAGTAILAQANSSTQIALQLLK
jgi:flagellin